MYTFGMNFVQKNLLTLVAWPSGRRAGAWLKKTSTAGICFFRKREKLAVLYKLRKTVRLLDDGSTEDCWLGTNSNLASEVRPMTISDKSTLNVLVVVDRSALDAMLASVYQAQGPFGPEFARTFPKGPINIDKTHASIKDYFHNPDGSLIDNETKVLVRLPLCVTIPFGKVIRTGDLNQEAYTQLSLIESDFMVFWAEWLNKHDQELQGIFLDTTSNATLKQFLPPSAPTGHGYISSPFIVMNDIDQDDEACIEQANELRNECNLVVTANKSKANVDDTSLAGKSVEIMGVTVPPSPSTNEVAAANILSTMSKVASPAIPAPTPLLTFTMEEHCVARAKSMGVKYHASSRKFELPEISEFYPAICAMTSHKNMRDTIQHTLFSIEDVMSELSHYLMRYTDIPTISNVGLNYLGQCQWTSEPIESLDIDSSNGFIINMIFPDTYAMAKVKTAANNENAAEEALGEHHSKKGKMATGFDSINELGGMSTLLTVLANTIVTFRLYWKFDLNDESTWPSVVSDVITLTDMVTSKKARKFMKKQPRAEKDKFIYYVMNQVLGIVTCFVLASKDVTVTSSILRQATDEASVSTFVTAHKIFESTKDKLDQILMNSSETPSCPLWKSAPAKEKYDAKDRKAIAALLLPAADKTPKKDKQKERRDQAQERDKNRQKTDQLSEGNFLKTSIPNLQLPGTVFNAQFRPCKSNARTDAKCSFGSVCNFDHTHFKDWTKARQLAMVKHVDSSDGKIEFVGVDNLVKKLRDEIKGEDAPAS